MDSRAKQRLTGAIILVALFVLLVPELLTGPREARAPAGDSTEEGLRQYTIDIDAQDRGEAKAPTTAPASVTLPPVETPMGNAPQLAQPGEAAAPANPATPTPVPKAPAPATSAPAEAPRAAPSTPRAVPGTFVVQLGSFSVRANADQLVREMTAKGFTAFVAPITSNGRELFRVRVGPTRDRASAEALAADLKKIGQSGSIVPIS